MAIIVSLTVRSILVLWKCSNKILGFQRKWMSFKVMICTYRYLLPNLRSLGGWDRNAIAVRSKSDVYRPQKFCRVDSAIDPTEGVSTYKKNESVWSRVSIRHGKCVEHFPKILATNVLAAKHLHWSEIDNHAGKLLIGVFWVRLLYELEKITSTTSKHGSL